MVWGSDQRERLKEWLKTNDRSQTLPCPCILALPLKSKGPHKGQELSSFCFHWTIWLRARGRYPFASENESGIAPALHVNFRFWGKGRDKKARDGLRFAPTQWQEWLTQRPRFTTTLNVYIIVHSQRNGTKNTFQSKKQVYEPHNKLLWVFFDRLGCPSPGLHTSTFKEAS